jgi:sec-independent protein translocase protein TatA
MFSPVQMLIIGAIAVLIFGDRLPEVAKSVGKGIMEFKKGLQGLQDELTSAINSADNAATPALTHSEAAVEDYEEATAPKFEPPPTPPSAQQAVSEPSPESIAG